MEYPIIRTICRIDSLSCPCCGGLLSDHPLSFTVEEKAKYNSSKKLSKYSFLFCRKCQLPFVTEQLSIYNKAKHAGYCLPEFSCSNHSSRDSIIDKMFNKVPVKATNTNTSDGTNKATIREKSETSRRAKGTSRMIDPYSSAAMILKFSYGSGPIMDYFIMNSKEEIDEENNMLFFGSVKARTLLTIAYYPQCRKKLTDDYKKYTFHGYTKKTKGISPIIRKKIVIRKGGGYYDQNNPQTEIVHALLYSPFTNRLELILVSYDKKGNSYYMDARRFREFISNYGNPGVNIVFKGKQSNSGYLDLNEESILKSYGYSVSQNDDLSFQQRCAILTELVDLNIISIPKIVSLLDFFILSHPDSKYFWAREKWLDDKNYISKYKANPNRFIIGFKH